MNGIPDPGRASKAVEILVNRAPVQEIDGELCVTTLVVASGTGNQHESVIRLVRENLADFEEFGRVRFEIGALGTAGGEQQAKWAALNEQQATLLMTYLRNNDAVRDFKKRLVREFYTLRNAVARPAIPQTYAEALRAHADEVERRELAESRVLVLEPKAEVADRLLDAEGDLSVRDAAQSLTRAGIKVGERRLFSVLATKGWIKRAVGDGRYRVLQTAIESGYMSVLPQSHYHPRTGILVIDPPQPRVTPKGLQRLLLDSGVES
jgi:phage regulator Rha-like protein